MQRWHGRYIQTYKSTRELPKNVRNGSLANVQGVLYKKTSTGWELAQKEQELESGPVTIDKLAGLALGSETNIELDSGTGDQTLDHEGRCVMNLTHSESGGLALSGDPMFAPGVVPNQLLLVRNVAEYAITLSGSGVNLRGYTDFGAGDQALFVWNSTTELWDILAQVGLVAAA